MRSRIARLSLITLLFLGLVGGARLLAPPAALAQIERVQMGVSGMI
ncbi:MAG: hypothetical protein ACE5IM_10020 [Nitrospinota bacterium]